MATVIETVDELNRNVWSFYFMNHTLFLDSYSKERRESKRHKFKAIKKYERLFHRGRAIEEAEVPMPDWVKEEAIKQFTEAITVKKWSEK